MTRSVKDFFFILLIISIVFITKLLLIAFNDN